MLRKVFGESWFPLPSWSSVSLRIFLDNMIALKSLQRSLMGVHLIHNLLFLCPALRILGALTKQCAKTESYLRHVCPPFGLSAFPKGITWLSQSKFSEILYWAIWLKYIDALHFCFKLDENNSQYVNSYVSLTETVRPKKGLCLMI